MTESTFPIPGRIPTVPSRVRRHIVPLYRFVLPAVLILLGGLFTSCGRGGEGLSRETAAALASDDAVVRDEGFRTVQASLVTDEAADAAGALVKAAGRRRREENGLIRESIDLSAGTIRYYSTDAAAALPETAGRTERGPLTVVDWGPEGELPAENRRPSIFVMFSQPMVPLAKLGERITETPILTIDPPVSGVYRWYGTRTLSFRPDSPLLESPRYRITVSARTASLSGGRLQDEFSFDVFGEPVKMVNVYPGSDPAVVIDPWDIPTGLARQFIVEFNQPVDPGTISEGLQVVVAGRSLPFTAKRPVYPEELESRTDRALEVELNQEPPEDAYIRVTLVAGAKPFADYPPAPVDQAWTMHTIGSFVPEELSAYAGGFPRDNRPSLYPVYLRYSHPLDESVPTPDYRVMVNGKPREPGDIVISWYTVAFYLPDIRPGDVVEVRVPDGVKDIHGRTGPAENLSIEIPRPDPMVDFPYHWDGLRHLEAEFPPALVWSTRNIVEGSFGLLATKNFFDDPGLVPQPSGMDFSQMPRDVTVFHREDLKPHLSAGGFGTVRFGYSLRQDPAQVNPRWQWTQGEVAVQVTDLGLSVRAAYDRVLVWVNRLSDGRPVSGAVVTAFNLEGARFEGVTDGTGLAVIPLPAGTYRREFADEGGDGRLALHVRAESGGDLAELLVRNTNDPWQFGVYNVVEPAWVEEPVHRIHMFTDRGLYKGGEQLGLRGIHWVQSPAGFEDYQGTYSIAIENGITGQTVWNSKGRTSASGGFAHRLTLPDDLEPGPYTISYGGDDFYGTAEFRIAAFRRVAFQVSSSIDGGPHFHGDTLEAGVQASYLAGGAMPSASYHYFWTRRPVSYRPPGTRWENWSFGTTDWAPEQNLTSGDGNLSGAGSVRVSLGTVDHEVTGKAYTYTMETTVEDVDRQVISSVASTLVHPSDLYIGARFDSGAVDGWWSRFVPLGDEVTVLTRLVNVDGESAAVSGTMRAILMRGEWKSADQQGLYGRINTRWEYVETEVWSEDLAIRGGEAKKEFSVEEPGDYTLVFERTDDAGRTAKTEIDFYATGSGWVARASRTPDDINLIVDKSLYEAGETARILVQSPLPEGRYLVTVEREGILDQKVVELKGSNALIEIPVKAAYVPVFHVAITSFTERTETEDDYFEPDLGRPRGLFGLTTVRVATTPVELDVDVDSVLESYGPGDRAEIVVRVYRNGSPVNGAEVTLLAVDRGVLDLIDYHVPNPLEYFYAEDHFPHGVAGDDSRRLLLRPVTYEISDLQGGGSAKDEQRTDFNPLALFEPEVRTGPDGTARVTVTLPDSLTTYRMTAVALNGTALGFDENEFQVSNPINVRTALPRRLRNRDTAAAGVVLTNTTGSPQEVRVSVESDILTIAGPSERTVTLPPRSTTELPFVLEALTEGEGVIRFTTRSSVLNEVLEEKVTVERPLVVESFATIGAVPDDGNSDEETLVLPSRITEGFGDLTFTADSTLRPYIDPVLDRLANIPYPSLADDLFRLGAELAREGRIDGTPRVFTDLAVLQFPGGGLGYRSPNLEWAAPDWLLSVLAAHLDLEISRREKQLRNPIDMKALESYLEYRFNEARSDDHVSLLSSWTAWVLAERGVISPADLDWLENAGDRLGIAGYNLVSMAYGALGRGNEARALYERSRKFVTFGTRGVDIAQTYETADYFSSGRSEAALMLRNAVLLEEDAEIVLRLAGSLNDSRHSRRFTSVFDDFWVVMAFLPILETETERSGYRFTLKVAERTLHEERLGDRGNQAAEVVFPLDSAALADLDRDTLLPLTVGRDGRGELYWAATLRYALPVETALPRDEGIEIQSRVETLDGDIAEEEDLPLGETFRMVVDISTLSRRSFLKLTVPLPSGAEIVDPSFATTGSYRDSGGTGGESWTRETVYGDETTFDEEGFVGFGPDSWWFWFYRPLQTVYDNAVTYRWEDFYAGRREVSFLFRTTTPGVYPTPPVSAVLEFEPEVFGRTAGRLAVIRGE